MQHYNAFISYRHAPKDSKIAEMLQKKLESYRVPSKISQQHGKKIERIFRDKEELPITYDLNDDINNALLNSDYLIVICSTSTSQSQWVTKEIETFLKTHKKQDVFTVLVDGEPYEVIPPILLTDEIRQVQPNGEVAVTTVPLEPLSCDLRNNPRKAVRTEMLRLLAPMLGCSFDTLYQRHRRRKTRQAFGILTGISIAASLFSVYALNRAAVISRQADEISSAYQKALISESQILNLQAKTLIEENDPGSAIKLLLKALPSELQKRPVLPESVKILTDLLGIYQFPTDDYRIPQAAGTLRFDYDAEYFLDDGKYLFSYKKYADDLTVWDAATLAKCSVIDAPRLSKTSEALLLSESHQIILLCQNEVRCVDYTSGALIWATPLSSVSNAVLSSDRKSLWVQSSLFRGASLYQVSLYQLSLETGTSSLVYQGTFDSDVYSLFDVSEDGKYAVLVLGNFVEDAADILCTVDLQAGNICNSRMLPYNIEQFHICGNRIITLGYDGYLDEVDRYSVRQEGNIWMEAREIDSLERIWRTCAKTVSEALTKTIQPVQFKLEDTISDGLLFVYADQCILLDQDTGETMRSYSFSSSICGFSPAANGLYVVTSGGDYAVVAYPYEEYLCDYYFEGKWENAKLTEGAFFLKKDRISTSSSKISKFADMPQDPGFEFLSEEAYTQAYTAAVNTASSEIRDDTLILHDGEGKEFVISSLPNAKAGVIAPDGQRAYLYCSDDCLVQYDLAAGQETYRISLSGNTYDCRLQALDSGEVLLFVPDGCYLFDTTDEAPVLIAAIQFCTAYDSAENRFLADRYGTYGAFHHYSLPELIELSASRSAQTDS